MKENKPFSSIPLVLRSMQEAGQKNILLIAPQYPTAINGLGDYAARLGEGLAGAGHVVHYAGLPQALPVTVQPYTTLQPNGTHLWQLVQEQHINIVVLNYSGYGYQRRGIPFWLPAAFQQVQKNSHCRIIVFFHELYASGPPWTSAFWLHPAQKALFKKILCMADMTFTSNDFWYRRIQKTDVHLPYKLKNIGLFSNIPEPTVSLPWAQRLSVLVVFGSAGTRKHVYSILPTYATDWKSKINEIWDIGESLPPDSLPTLSIPIKQWGVLTDAEVSQCLVKARYGALYYADDLLAKSGVIAAYAAHGLCIWNGTTFSGNTGDGLTPGVQYINPNTEADEASVALAAQQWYAQHNYTQHITNWVRAIQLLNQ